jgi:serine/threonine protein phosphatase 1
MAEYASGRRFAIADVHGCAASFDHLLHHKLRITAGDRLLLLGDLINRGPNSKAVLKQVMALRQQGVEVILLRGNHEAVLLDAYETGRGKDFLRFGGDATLQSFGVKKVAGIPPKYIDLLREGKYFHIEEPYVFVHAGLNFSRPTLFEDKEAMLWTRKMTIDRQKLGDRIIIHGHTPWPKSAIKGQFEGQALPPVINIDGGCVYNRPGNRLVALNIDTMDLTFVKFRKGSK